MARAYRRGRYAQGRKKGDFRYGEDRQFLMSKSHVTVTVFGVKQHDDIGMLQLRVRIPPSLRHPKKLRRAYADGVAEGVARMMDHIQPEGDGFP